MMRTSQGSDRLAHGGRGIQVKVNLPIFEDEKVKDVVTYCSWQWDVAFFWWSVCDNQHLLPYIFSSLQGFLGDLARSFGEDASLSNVLQTFDEHYGVVMMFNASVKSSIPLSRIRWECSRVWGVSFTAGPDTPVRVPGEDSARTHRRDEAWLPLWGS